MWHVAVVRLGGAHVVVPHVGGRGRAGGRAVRRGRPGRRAVPQPRGALRPQGQPLDQGQPTHILILTGRFYSSF